MGMKIAIQDTEGKKAGEIELKEEVFSLDPHPYVVHQVVRLERAQRRSGTASTRGRSEVRGGGVKPWRQKGTGRARAGSIRSPLWRGGGTVFGPKPRDYSFRVPKKVKKLALCSVLSQAARDDRIRVVEDFALDRPSTRVGKSILSNLDLGGRVMVVTLPEDENVYKSFRNLEDVEVFFPSELNAYDVLRFSNLLFLREALEKLEEGFGNEGPS
ncbi:MAG: 50S ribosomal protein L4 [Actinomycetota bacterium]|nr:50S ribosomal protein L4 [Actinomycetota bacterium]